MKNTTIRFVLSMLMLLTGTASALAQQIYGTTLPLTESSETAYYPNYFLSPPEGSWDAPTFLGQVDPDDNGAYMQCGAWCGDAYYVWGVERSGFSVYGEVVA